MGYTHYYYVSSEFDKKSFAKVAADFKKLVTPLKHLGIVLADVFGENHPVIRPTEIKFNGLAKCGHPKRDPGETYPSDNASGVCNNNANTTLEEITESNWVAGAYLKTMLETRTCRGDCSHEGFSLEQKLVTSWTDENGRTQHIMPDTRNRMPANEVGKHFECTKTAHKPYDLAVTACLVIAKHHLKDDIIIYSDGAMKNWYEAMVLCDHFLGYGKNFSLDREENYVSTYFEKIRQEEIQLQKPRIMQRQTSNRTADSVMSGIGG